MSFPSVSAAGRFIANLLATHELENEYWVDFARRLPPARFIVWIGNEVATSLISETNWNRQCVAEVIAVVECNTSGPVQFDAERFLVHRYVNRLWQPPPSRCIILFRHIIQHRLALIR